MRFLKLFRTEEQETDEEQIRAYRQSGELRVLGKLYQPYMEMVFAVCYKYLRDEDESKDAVMQLFEKLVIELRTHEVDHFKGWLYRVATNHCLMMIRTKKVFAEMDEADNSTSHSEYIQEDPVFELEHHLAALDSCLESLNEEQRTSINLFFKQEKCYREISDQTGYDFNKVKSYIQNGKRNLKICMDKNGTN